MTAPLVPVAAAALAAFLGVRPPRWSATSPPGSSRGGPPGLEQVAAGCLLSLGSRLARAGPAALAATAAGVLLWGGGQLLLLAAVAAEVGWGVLSLVRRGRLARQAQRRQAAVVELCEALVGELQSGRPVVVALQRSAEVWPEFGTVPRAAVLAADVPAAVRRLALLPGAEAMEDVASAFVVSGRAGVGLASALAQVAESARSQQLSRQLVQGELASARATARLVALLPVAALLMAAGTGGRPWHFLLATTAGAGCLAAGTGLVLTGLWWIDRIADGVLSR